MITPQEVARIVACTTCTTTTSAKLQRDEFENVPQPGFVGSAFSTRRVMLAGQNPGVCPPRFASRDADYTAALRAVRDNASGDALGQLQRVLLRFVPDWPVHGNYFPLQESGFTLDDIAYCNVGRCRTAGSSAPSKYLVRNCLQHFDRWLGMLEPRIVVFIGKWAHDAAAHLVHKRRIPAVYMNRERSLSAEARQQNREEVTAAVRAAAA